MYSIKNLLQQIAIINDKNAEILDATGGRFNIFQICGVNHYENTHSKIIAELLDPNGTHGLKSKLFECFIETLGDHLIIKDFDCNNSSVFTEYSIPKGRIDILIQNANDVIIIENKIYARDGKTQLKRYHNWVKKQSKGHQMLYLTLLGNEADKNSSRGVPYTPISYKETIIKWLEKCVEIASRYPLVRETIVQYINHLKKLTHQDMNTKNQEEITEVLSEIENLKAAKAIYENYSKTYDYLADKYFNPEMKKYAKKKGLIYDYKESGESYIEFDVYKPDWSGKFCIGFVFYKKKKYACGIYIINQEDTQIEKIRSKLEDYSAKEHKRWIGHKEIGNLSIEKWKSDIVDNKYFFERCKQDIEFLLGTIKKAEA